MMSPVTSNGSRQPCFYLSTHGSPGAGGLAPARVLCPHPLSAAPPDPLSGAAAQAPRPQRLPESPAQGTASTAHAWVPCPGPLPSSPVRAHARGTCPGPVLTPPARVPLLRMPEPPPPRSPSAGPPGRARASRGGPALGPDPAAAHQVLAVRGELAELTGELEQLGEVHGGRRPPRRTPRPGPCTAQPEREPPPQPPAPSPEVTAGGGRPRPIGGPGARAALWDL